MPKHSTSRRSVLTNRRSRALAISAALILAVSASACDGNASGDSLSASPSTGDPMATSAPEYPSEVTAKDFDPSLFDDTSHIVDNEYFPLVPGTRYVWEGSAFDDEGQPLERMVIFTVTDLTKVIGGVRTVVGWDRDFNDGVMGESELIFFAQDVQGTVWHLGEYVEHWDGNELDGGRYWAVGDPDGAEAGLHMPAEPSADSPSFSQGYAPPPWFWDDHGRISKVGVRDCVPVGCYDDALIIEEFEPRFPGAVQLKYYAPGVGGIRVAWTGNDEEQEEMELTRYFELSPEALDKARAEALAMEDRAYSYGRTEPATQVP